MNSNPDNILRPSSPEALGVILSEFLNNNNGILPSGFAAEIAPFILFNFNGLTLQEYDDNSILYSLRVSIASMNLPAGNAGGGDVEAPTNFSFGARITFIDEGDLKNDTDYRAKLFELTAEAVKLKTFYEAQFLMETGYKITDVLSDPILNDQKENYIKEKIGETYDKRLEEVKTEYKKNNWNKRKWDLAYASLGTTIGSNNKTKIIKHSMWTTFAEPISTWGQLLLGGNFNFLSGTEQNVTISIASRLYGGVNRIKGFCEAQYEYNDITKGSNLFLDLGSEINVYDGIWVNFDAGLELIMVSGAESTSEFASHFDLRFTIPEDFNLF